MQEKGSRVYVIIVTYNGSEHIKKCVDSLYNASWVPTIVVVDNRSTDDTLANINKNYSDKIIALQTNDLSGVSVDENKNLYLYENPTNDGFGKANNIGIKFALNQGADYIFLLNQDTWVFPETIENLVHDMEEFPRIGILSPLQYSPNNHPETNEPLLDDSFKRYYNHKPSPISQTITRVPFVNAAAWMLRAKHIRMIGYFDEVFKHYGEDRNYCSRINYNKFAIAITQNAKIVHNRVAETSYTKDIRQSKYLILNTFLDYSLSPFGQNLQAIRQTIGLPKYFLKKHGIFKSLQLFFILVWFYFVDILYLKTHKKSSDEIKARIEQTFKPKQFFMFSGINYLGLFINVFATLFIFSNNLELLGKVRFIETIGTLLYPLLLLGSSYTLINYYSFLQKTNTVRKFLGDAMLLIFGTTFLVLFLYAIFDYFVDFKYSNLGYLGLIFAGTLAFFELFKAKANLIGKPILPQIIEKINPRIILSVLFVLSFYNLLVAKQLLIIYILIYIVMVLVLYLQLLHYTKPKFRGIIKAVENVTNFKNSKTKYSIVMLLSSFGFLLAFRIDGFMIPFYLDMKQNGLFNIVLIIVSFITIPATTLFSLSSPAISNLIDQKQYKALQRKYKQAAKVLLFMGGTLVSIYFLVLPKVFEVYNESLQNYSEIPTLIFVMSIAALVNVSTSFNSEILMYSKHYKFNALSLMLLAVSSIGLNYYFLNYTNLGLLGVAIASAISLIVFNLVKVWFIYKKFNITPFDLNFFRLILLLLATFSTVYFLSTMAFTNGFLSIIGRVFLVILLNLWLVYQFNLVCVYTHFVRKYILKNLPENNNFIACE